MKHEGFRLNIIDHHSAVSFLGPAHAAKAVAAACSHGATTWQEVLGRTRRYDPDWTADVRRGLLQFEEHQLPSEDPVPPVEASFPTEDPFRIWDAETRRASLEPGKLGLVIFNLKEQRIIQVQNSYSDLQRQGRGRIRLNGRPTPTLYHYKLPEDWAILP
jgi:hypothetical protein